MAANCGHDQPNSPRRVANFTIHKLKFEVIHYGSAK